MQAPFWLPLWRAAEALLAVATEAAVVLPVMILLSLALGRRRHREALANAGHLFLNIGLVTAAFGLFAIAGNAFVSLQALPASMDSLVPLAFEPFTAPWLASTTAFLAWMGGILCLVVCRQSARPVYRTAFAGMDPVTERQMDRRAILACIAALVAFGLFFASIILRNWPFLGLPEQMSQETVFQVLLRHTWRQSCAALMPAGGFAVLSFFLQLPPMARELKALDRENRRREVIPGTAEEIAPFTEIQTTTVRMCAAFALAGATFQFLDASFLAFNPMAAMGSGLRVLLMRFGPFLVTALSIVCWAFIFARPRRQQFVLALVPVLLILLRAVADF